MTTRRLMILVLVVAVLLALIRWSALGAFVLCLMGLGATCAWLAVRGHRHRAFFYLVTSAFTANATVAAICVYLLSLGGIMFMCLVAFVTIPLILGSGAGWVLSAAVDRSTRRRSLVLGWALVLALAFSPVTMMSHFWPLRLAFLASRPALDRLADRVGGGQTLSRPEWAGLYRVVGSTIDLKTGNVGLIIDANSGGRSGFVRLLNGRPAKHSGPLYNLNFDEPMDGRWLYQNED